MEKDCRSNIIELHIFIESWLKGSVDKSRLVFQYFEEALDDNFIIIHPSGEQQARSDLVSGFWNAYGIQPDNFSIEIRDIKTRFISENICTMNYEEWQTGVEKSARISTVIFQKSMNSGKIHWLHLHETWYPKNIS